MPASSWVDRRALLLLIVLTGALLRAWRAAGLDVFEDGYHHWYIALNLLDTGVLGDGISGMTGGNWLPLYYYAAAGAFSLTGSTSIYVLKGLGILCSVATMLLVFMMGERWKRNAGLVAALFFALNPLDILLSSMSLPDSLALTLLTASLYLFIFHSGRRAPLVAAGALLAAAAATRYEVWAVLPVIFLFVTSDRSEGRLPMAWRLAVFVPSLAFTLSWLGLHSGGGSLAGIVFGQTALQPAIVAQRTGLDGLGRAGLFWLLYGANEAVLLVLAGAFYYVTWKRKERLPRGMGLLSAVLAVLFALVTVLVAAGLLVGSYRYLSFTVVTVVLAASLQVGRMADAPAGATDHIVQRGWRPAAAAGLALLLLMPSLQFSVAAAGASSTLNEPQVRTGLWLRHHLPHDGGLVLTDSPISAYYSGLPPARIIGSAALPGDMAAAREYVLDKVEYVVYIDHPFFRVTKAFPELKEGRSAGYFSFLYSPNDWRVDYGALPAYVYRVDKELFSMPAAGGLSLRVYNSTVPATGKIALLEKGAVLVDGGNETAGEGAGLGAPALAWRGTTYYSRSARTAAIEGGCSKTFVLDTVEVGPFHRTSFASVPPAGEVRVDYRTNGSVLSIDADLTKVPRDATLMMLNELDGRRYTRYVDFDGNDTTVDFPWRKVTGWYNYLLAPDGSGFRVDYTPGFYNGTTLFLGRETAPAGFDWAGLDYAVDLSIRGASVFSYQIRLLEAGP